MSRRIWLFRLIPTFLLIIFNAAYAQVQCKYDSDISYVPIDVPLKRRSPVSGLIFKEGPDSEIKFKRSIARCRGIVENVEVPEDAKTYLDVPLGGIVSIVESILPWEESGDGDITPICSGVFVEETKVISSAHCVFHQRRDPSDTRFWLFGEESMRRRYFYAITGKTSQADPSISVYPLKSACIPESYTTAENETVTSGQMNDIAIFTTLSPFRGGSNEIAEFVHALPSGNELREYMLPQYPLDVSSGAQLVIDVSTSPLYKTTYFGGTFYSVDLVSWIGSSGGAIIDIKESQVRKRPVMTGLLMSEGWQLCDSGILPVTSLNEHYYQLISANQEDGRSDPPETEIVQNEIVTSTSQGPPPLVSNSLISSTGVPLRKNPMNNPGDTQLGIISEPSPSNESDKESLEPSPQMG